MTEPSDASRRFASTVQQHLGEFTNALGFEARPYGHPVKVGVTAQTFVRDLPNDVEVTLTLWTHMTGGRCSLHWRLDVMREGKGLPGGELSLRLPYPDAQQLPWTHTGEQFRAFESDAHFERAIEFIGTLLITLAPEMSKLVPELEPLVLAAQMREGWQKAPARNAELWRTRLLAGQSCDMREDPATFVFIGQNLVSLDCAGRRITFKFDTSGLDRDAPARISGWWTTPAGTEAATILRVGAREWRFDTSGKLETQRG